MTLIRNLLGTNPVSGAVDPEAVSFDGTNDYLSRSSDLSGNTDSKTFTFSTWAYFTDDGAVMIFENRPERFYFYYDPSSTLQLQAADASGSWILNINTNAVNAASLLNRWNHILISLDLTSTANRHFYINDVAFPVNWPTYTNSAIDFTGTGNFIGANLNGGTTAKGRMSNMFQDYTYRDLSIESNRRLFIDSDGKPSSGLESVNNYGFTKLSVGSQDTFPLEIFMSTDGTKFYMVGKTTDTVYQYSLSTAYDISSAVYNSVSFSVASQSTEPMGVSFSVDGTKMYIVEASNGLIYQYTLTTGFDLSTASYASKSFDTSSQRGSAEVQDVSISSDGTRLYMIVGNHIYEYTLSTAFDISTATYNSKTYNYSSQVLSCVGMAFGNSGTKLYIMGAVSIVDIIFEYTLSTAWDVSTASYSGNSFVATGRTNDGTGLALSSNGEHLYSIGYTGDTAFQYNMSTAYDLSTASGSSPIGSPEAPILYLPMTDAATAGSNSGTGGDFTVNGVLDTASRAPNQDNCSASEFDGVNDYLSHSSITTGNPDTYTISIIITRTQNNRFVYANRFRIFDTEININSAGGNSFLTVEWPPELIPQPLNMSMHVTLSFDINDSSKRWLIINGIDVTSTANWSDYVAGTAAIDGNTWLISKYTSPERSKIGEFYFDTNYTDLSSSNPFWNSATNRPKPVRQVISETGTTPLIALPLRADDAGNNLGTGGDFTVNSGPYTGARGGSEFWARSANFDGSSGYLSRGSLTGASDSTTFSLFVDIATTVSSSPKAQVLNIATTGGLIGLEIYRSAYTLTIRGYNTSGTLILEGTSLNWFFSRGAQLALSIDMTSSANSHVYVFDGSWADINLSWSTFTNGTLNLASDKNTIGANWNSSGYDEFYAGDLSGCYFTTDYIDFSQESNRNLFVDQLGYPKDLTPAIDAGDIAEPLIYMKFDDTSALGTNSGTGGNFTVNGTVTAGADVQP